MNNNNLINLINIYNLLTEISTKGEDTLRMSDCLRAFRKEIMTLQQNEENDIKQKEE